MRINTQHLYSDSEQIISIGSRDRRTSTEKMKFRISDDFLM